jgi:formylglycine-generating enzyme required for sulfatase activity
VALLATLLSAFAFRRPMPVPGYVSTAAEVRMLAVSTQTQFAVPVNQLLVPVGSFRPGSPNTASILPLCASVDGDTDACARWLAREAPTGTQQVAEFWLDRVEVSNQEFVSWVNELNGPLRGAEAGAALLRGDRLLWRQTQDYSALRLDASGAVPKLSVDTASATLPVVGVTWYAANEYCTAHAARLPTATEWEYAARGPAASEYVWSEAPACEAAAYGRVPVGRQSRGTCGHLPAAPNSTGKSLVDRSWCGVLDLGTNVSEWVNDAFVEKASSEPATHCVYASPENLGACHVIKGGSFADPLFVARPASVTRGLPETVFPHVGFRCAKSIGS